DPDFRAIVRVFGAGSRPAATAVVRGDPTPDGRVAGATDHRGVSLGNSSRLLGAGQRSCVRPLTSRVRAMGIRDRPISPRSPWQKSVCGASDWHRASGVRGPGAGLWRGAPATNSFFLRGVLQ